MDIKKFKELHDNYTDAELQQYLNERGKLSKELFNDVLGEFNNKPTYYDDLTLNDDLENTTIVDSDIYGKVLVLYIQHYSAEEEIFIQYDKIMFRDKTIELDSDAWSPRNVAITLGDALLKIDKEDF